MILGLLNVLLLRLNLVQKTSCVACPRCRSEAVLIEVSVGFLCCHLSCYLLARGIMFLSRIMRSTGSIFARAEGRLFLWWKAGKRPITHSPYLFMRPHGSEGMWAEGEKKNRIKNQFNNYVSFLSEATPARERSPIAKKLWLSIHLDSHLTVLPSVQPHHRVTNVKCHTF